MNHTQTITKFLVEEFLPDVPAESLAADYDLLSGGVIDSLGLLRVIAWLEDRFDVVVDDIEIAPDNFRTVTAMSAFVQNARRTG
ncbi:MAG: acyl carrier protein [Pseudonocardiales bacterium]|nr:acyl carrier protein [Pseudonocardiales bacterium]MBV9029715.1 acyl carrier protein [Pseudonocardiales bacterium]MBW0010071.1 acyl carrier protein [Pseudonocardiales bacterium]